MRFTRSTIFLAVILLLSLDTLAQGLRKKYADKEYANLNYYYATEAYEDVLAKTGDSSSVIPRIAESYLKIGNTQKAITWYSYMNRVGNLSMEEQLNLALLYREVSDYDQSSKLFTELSEQYKSNDVVSTYLKSSNELSELKKSSDIFKLSESVLSTSSSDLSVAYGKSNKLFVTSSKRSFLPFERRHGWTGDFFYSVYHLNSEDQGDLSKLKGDINSKYSDAYVAYDSINNYVYFTRDNSSIKSKTSEAHLVLCRGKEMDGKVNKVEELSFGDGAYSYTHPTITSDGRVLYFSSNIPGGEGGMDLYKVDVKEDGSFGAPVNLGSKINTPLDEVTPSIKDKENVLFFASKGHLGLGGLDVFVAKMSNGGEVVSIENLGVPINSEKDDFSFVNDKGQKAGYLVSNRSEDDNIYSFTQAKKITAGLFVKGIVTEVQSKKSLENIKIVAIDKDGNTLKETETLKDGSFDMDLNDYSEDYVLRVSNDSYETKELSCNADDQSEKKITLSPILSYDFEGKVMDSESKEGLLASAIYIIDPKIGDTIIRATSAEDGTFKTESIEQVYGSQLEYDVVVEKEGYVTERSMMRGTLGEETTLNLNEYLDLDITKIEEGETDLGIIANINPIYFDLNSSVIREDAAKELNKIYSVLQDNPDLKIELRSHTDIRGERSYNKSLSEKRAKSSVDYLINKGVSSNRLISKGMGEEKPKVSEQKINHAKTEKEKEELHQLNRRTEFIVIK